MREPCGERSRTKRGNLFFEAIMKKFFIFVVLATFVVQAFSYVVKVSNPLNESRTSETICIDLKSTPVLVNLFVFSETLKKEIPFQFIDDNNDGKNDQLVFQADFESYQVQRFRVQDADEFNQPMPEFKSIAYYVPQRKDDFAWENDKIAFRMYGQELQRTEPASSGIDVWVKSVKYPVMPKMYKKGPDYYNSDNGESLDFFDVGQTLGCGGIGVLLDKKLYCSQNYFQWKIIANGPIRTIFELTYKPWQAGKKTVGETKRITLDLGSNFNLIESRFDADVNDVNFAVGIAKCQRGGTLAVAGDKSWLAYWQKPDEKLGSIACGLIVPKGISAGQFIIEEKNNMLLAKADKNNTIVYYAGAAWSRTPEFDSREKWSAFVEKQARIFACPLKVEIFAK